MAAREGAIMPVGHIQRVAGGAGDYRPPLQPECLAWQRRGPGGHGCAGGRWKRRGHRDELPAGGRSGNEVIQWRARLLTRARPAGASGQFRSGIASEPDSRR